MGEHVPDEAREQSWLFPHAAHLLQPALAAMPAGARGRPSDFTQARKTVSRYIRGERQLTATGYERMRTDAQLHDEDRKSTRLNSSHVAISYAVFCLKKKKKNKPR